MHDCLNWRPMHAIMTYFLTNRYCKFNHERYVL
jgi:hypothetical protein